MGSANKKPRWFGPAATAPLSSYGCDGIFFGTAVIDGPQYNG
ncbi:MAG: hypothetical protein QOE52_4979 [Mycobacterium sp.]|jgi:hypothetical protein|nr:hypothetical protein [Mycobacterium sp.]MDT5254709.1 hypothetical protein [Mycobacterium sp.]MDT5305581.1 hypothetical protein [Mycobacterium sp.]MDT5345795.1 hypothetical protein [Mycobacterium sp.]